MIDPRGLLTPSTGRRGVAGAPSARVAALFGEIRLTGALSDRSLTWIASNASRLGEDTLFRLRAAVETTESSDSFDLSAALLFS
jgi:hypothetical protein